MLRKWWSWSQAHTKASPCTRLLKKASTTCGQSVLSRWEFPRNIPIIIMNSNHCNNNEKIYQILFPASSRYTVHLRWRCNTWTSSQDCEIFQGNFFLNFSMFVIVDGMFAVFLLSYHSQALSSNNFQARWNQFSLTFSFWILHFLTRSQKFGGGFFKFIYSSHW